MRLTPRTVRAGIARLEASPFIKPEIARIKERLALQQHKMNKATLGRVRKQEQLLALQEQLRMLEQSTVVLSDEDVRRKEEELGKLEERVERELAVSDSLTHMIHTRKSALIFVKKSITALKATLKHEASSLRSSLTQDVLNDDYKNALENDLRLLTVQRQRISSELLRASASSYEELRSRHKLRTLLAQERQFQSEAVRSHSNWTRLQTLEKDLVKAQGED